MKNLLSIILSSTPPSHKFLVTSNSYNAVRNLIFSILYTFPTSSSSLPVAHVLPVQIPSQEHNLICELGKKGETLQRGSSRPRKTMVFTESAWPLQHGSTPQVSIPVSESRSGASIPGDTYVTLAGPREPGGERQPPFSPTIPHCWRSDRLRLLGWVKSDLPRLSAQALTGNEKGQIRLGWSVVGRRARVRESDNGGNVERGKREIKELLRLESPISDYRMHHKDSLIAE